MEFINYVKGKELGVDKYMTKSFSIENIVSLNYSLTECAVLVWKTH